MPTPTIDSTQSVLGYRAYETFSFLAGGSGSPDILYWQATSLPSGLSLDAPAEKACTCTVANTITCTAHGYANGDKVYFQSVTLVGGALPVVPGTAEGIYYVRDKTDNSFKLASTLTGTAIAITEGGGFAGQIRKCGTGLITGSVSTPGIYVFGLSAMNMATGTWPAPTGLSSVTYFTLGIEAGDGSTSVAGSTDLGIDINIDAITREVTMASSTAAAGGGAIFLLKEDDTVILNIRFKKNGVALDPAPTDLAIAFKELETESVLFSAGGSKTATPPDFMQVGTGAAAVCQVPVTVTSDALASALSNYESDAGTKFNALCEIEWKQTMEHFFGSTDLNLVSSSKTFLVTIERDLVV